jgi:radical SAM superfamily enzyme YgiQ (UPF0313 family)
MVQVYPTRGCPLSCTFCVAPLYYGGHGRSHKSHRTRDIDNVCDELEHLATKYAPRFSGAFFNEEAHNANPEWLAAFCKRLINRGLNRYHYDAMCGYWNLTDDMIALMARAGYCMIRLGIESLSEGVGKAVGKRVFPDKFLRVLEWCQGLGVAVHGTCMVGAPGSTADDDLYTLATLWEWKHQGLLADWQYGIATPQPGTPFFEQAKREGLLTTEDYTLYDWHHAVVDWPDYPAREVERVKLVYDAHWSPMKKGDDNG